MRRWTTTAALFAAIAIIAGCTRRWGTPSGSAASAPAEDLPPRASQASSARRQRFRLIGGVQSPAAGGCHADVHVIRRGLPGSAAQGVARALHGAHRRPVPQEDENSSNATIKAQVESGQVTWGRRRRRQRLRARGEFRALLEELDASLIPINEVNQDLGPSKWRVPDITYGVVLAYNTEQTAGQVPVPAGRTSSTRRNSPASAGCGTTPRAGSSRSRSSPTASPRPTSIRSTSQRATAKLDTIKDDLVFWASGAEIAGA